MIVELEKEINNRETQLNVELISDNTTRFEREREDFFNNLMKLISTLREINCKLKDLLPFPLNIEKLEEELKKKARRLSDQLRTIASKIDLSQRDFKKFCMYYNHLSDFNVRDVLEESDEKILEKVKSLCREIAVSSSDIAKITDMLIKVKLFAENLPMFNSKIHAEIDEALKTYKKENGILAITQLATALEKTDVGSKLIAEHACFAGEDLHRRRLKMENQDNIDYMLQELGGDDIVIEVLRTRYQTFRKTYDCLIDRYLSLLDQKSEKEPNLEVLISETKVLLGTVAPKSNTITWNHSFKDKIPELLAHIFAVWTLKNTQHYNAMRGIDAARTYLLIPHVGQVIAIFRILGIGYRENENSRKLINNLVEIGTGEGKSVVMAITACVFALNWSRCKLFML